MQSHIIQSPECLSSVSDLRAHRICTRQLQTSNRCISTPIENWTHIYMNLFTRNSPYYHILKYLLFLLKHPVYSASIPVWFLFSIFIALPLVQVSFLIFSSPTYSVVSFPSQPQPMFHSQTLQLVCPQFYIS